MEEKVFIQKVFVALKLSAFSFEISSLFLAQKK